MPSPQVTRSILVVLLSLFTLALSTTPAGAQTAPTTSYMFTVNTTADTHDAHPGDGKCADKNGKCSLRAAIEEADALPTGSSITITVPAGAYGLTLGTLALTANTITITGAARKTTIIKGNHKFTIMAISANVTVSLSRLTIERGSEYGNNHAGGIDNGGTLAVSSSALSSNLGFDAGGINNSGSVTVSNSIFSRNSAGSGGGINNSGSVTVSNSIFSGNTATYNGGGIDNESGVTLTISNSTFSGNLAGGIGGGIDNDHGATASVSNSTFSGNSAGSGGVIYDGGYHGGSLVSVSNSTFSGNSAGSGGVIEDYAADVTISNSTFSGNKATSGNGGAIDFPDSDGGSVSVSNSTFSGNSATGKGGGIANTNINGPLTLTGTIVTNSKGAQNCAGKITDKGYNLDSGTSCHFKHKSDLQNTDPMLGPLRNNGGSTKTMALLQGSKAIDWVALSSCPATDQRGYPRPDGNGEQACDIGAYESAY